MTPIRGIQYYDAAIAIAHSCIPVFYSKCLRAFRFNHAHPLPTFRGSPFEPQSGGGVRCHSATEYAPSTTPAPLLLAHDFVEDYAFYTPPTVLRVCKRRNLRFPCPVRFPKFRRRVERGDRAGGGGGSGATLAECMVIEAVGTVNTLLHGVHATWKAGDEKNSERAFGRHGREEAAAYANLATPRWTRGQRRIHSFPLVVSRLHQLHAMFHEPDDSSMYAILPPLCLLLSVSLRRRKRRT